jgi:hypothetical protein
MGSSTGGLVEALVGPTFALVLPVEVLDVTFAVAVLLIIVTFAATVLPVELFEVAVLPNPRLMLTFDVKTFTVLVMGVRRELTRGIFTDFNFGAASLEGINKQSIPIAPVLIIAHRQPL